MGDADDATIPPSSEESPSDDAIERQTLKELREKHGLADDNPLRHLRKHLLWLYSAERLAKAREQRIENSDGPCVYDELITHIYDRITGTPIFPTRAPRLPDFTNKETAARWEPKSTLWQRYVQFYRKLPKSKAKFDKFLSELDPLSALLDDSHTTDRIGLTETVDLLIGTVTIIADIQFARWSKQQKSYRVFAALFEPIRLRSIEKCRAVWASRDPDWVDRMVAPRAAPQLESAWGEWRNKARDAESERLETSAKTKRRRSTHARQARPLKASTAPELTTVAARAPRKKRGVQVNGSKLEQLCLQVDFNQKSLAGTTVGPTTIKKAFNSGRLDERKISSIVDMLNVKLKDRGLAPINLDDLVLPDESSRDS